MSRQTSSIQSIETVVDAATQQPAAVFVVGRGNRGKSFIIRYLAETARDAGKTIRLCDGDPTNPTTTKFFRDAVRLTVTAEAAARDWLEDQYQPIIDTRVSTIFDFGAADGALRLSALRPNLTVFFEGEAICPVMIHVLGSDLDDLNYLQTYETHIEQLGRALFAPPKTFLILNAGASQELDNLTEAFKPIINHEVFQAAVARGAVPIPIRYSREASKLNAHGRLLGSYTDKEDGVPVLPRLAQAKLQDWRREVDRNFAQVVDLL